MIVRFSIIAAADGLVEALIWLGRYPRERELARRKRLGLCRYCGYDVSGTMERCPECGRYPVYRKTSTPPNWPDIYVEDRASGGTGNADADLQTCEKP